MHNIYIFLLSEIICIMNALFSVFYFCIADELERAGKREYLRRIVAVTSFLGKQGISFRGHEEAESSGNQGNFLELMKLLEQFDPFLQIMADEARDGHVEQLAVCVRYVTAKGTVKEHFIELSSLNSFNAESITDAIERVLKSKGLNDVLCVAQTYDGASVMKGEVGGVQARFREKHPEAVYVHCYAHELNLVLCHTCRAVPEADDFFETLGNVYSFFSASMVNHQAFHDTQKQLGLENSEFVQLSKTRWECQLNSVKAVLENLTALLGCLEKVATPIVIGLLSKLSRCSSVYMLVMFKSLLSATEGFHKYLQKESVDLAQATLYKDAVLETLTLMRSSEETAEQLYKETKVICESNNISEILSGPRRKQRRMDDYAVDSTLGTRAPCDTGNQLKHHLLYPCLDRMISELSNRFSGVGEKLMKGIQACNPAADDFLSEESLNLIAAHYKIQLCKEELLVAKQFLAKKKKEGAVSDMASAYKLLDPDMFPTLSLVFQAALTIPVSSSSCERSFSALRRLHTWLRRTMGQKRLNHLAVLSIEKGILSTINTSMVIDRFAQIVKKDKKDTKSMK
uniref:HAT C-terminal dimerisation domain-containing protein n=1 Tax=Sinocyclocheilus grahami TaxID=75366 RepID=A0A672LRI1_SINGR